MHRVPKVSAAVPLVAALLVSGCATSHLDEYNQVEMGNARPATAPGPADPESGAVVDVGSPVRALVALGGDRVAAQLDEPARLVVGRVRAGRFDSTATISLPADAGIAAPGSDGGVLVPYGDGVVVVTPDLRTRQLPGMGAVTAVAQPEADTLLTGDAHGTTTVRSADGSARSQVTGLTSVDQIVTAAGKTMAVSRPDTVVSSISTGSGEAGPMLRAGKAAGRAVADATGRAVVTDTTGNALLVYTLDPVRLHQMFPVGAAPWAVAEDPDRHLTWVTTTGDDRLVGYDLGGGVGVRVAGVRTVHRPESVAVTADGTVLVGSADGGGIHVVRPTVAPVDAAPAP